MFYFEKLIQAIVQNKKSMLPPKTKTNKKNFKSLLENIGNQDMDIRNFLGRPVKLNLEAIGQDRDVTKLVNSLDSGYCVQICTETDSCLILLPSNSYVWLKKEYILF